MMGIWRSCIISTTLLLCSTMVLVEGYKNYTVGDSMGWYDNQVKPGVDYQKWASEKSFSLGDFLLFNTDNNHSVIQTHNLTTFKSCDYTGEDVVEWSSTNPSSTAVYPVTVAVPLLKEGTAYFFSGDYDGEQCQNGQKFQINVTRGQGLPPSLKNNDGDSAAGPAADAESGSDDTTTISTDFNHPKDLHSGEDGDSDEDGGKTKGSASSSLASEMRFLIGVLQSMMVLVGLSRVL